MDVDETLQDETLQNETLQNETLQKVYLPHLSFHDYLDITNGLPNGASSQLANAIEVIFGNEDAIVASKQAKRTIREQLFEHQSHNRAPRGGNPSTSGDVPPVLSQHQLDRCLAAIDRLFRFKGVYGNRAPATAAIDRIFDDISAHLAEHWLGQVPEFADAHISSYTTETFDRTERVAQEYLLACLQSAVITKDDNAHDNQSEDAAQLSAPRPLHQACLLLQLRQACDRLWDKTLAYRTVKVITNAADAFGKYASSKCVQRSDGLVGWVEVLLGLGHSLEAFEQDTAVFGAINRGDTSETLEALRQATHSTKQCADLIPDMRQADDQELLSLAPLLEGVKAGCLSAEAGYMAMLAAAEGVEAFELWVDSKCKNGAGAQKSKRQVVLGALQHARQQVENILSTSKMDSIIRSRVMPWNALLDSLEEIAKNDAPVFAPSTLLLRYCFPFTIDVGPSVGERDIAKIDDFMKDLDSRLQRQPTGVGGSRKTMRERSVGPHKENSQFTARLSELLPLGHPKIAPLDLSHFWRGGGEELYSGFRVELPDVQVGGRSHKVWLELTNLHNHCLCVEVLGGGGQRAADLGDQKHEIRNPTPREIYKLMRTATPWGWGAKAASGSVVWDSLYLFAHDIIVAVAYAMDYVDDRNGPARESDRLPALIAGNPHEILVIETGTPGRNDPGIVARELEGRIGGRLLTRTVHRTASTLAEWVRFPAVTAPVLVSVADSAAVAPPTTVATKTWITTVPEMGFHKDWLIHSAETTVFGSSAVPTWLRTVFLEAGQFAASWSPLLELWTRRLDDSIAEARASHKNSVNVARHLRMVEQIVRRHTADLRSAQLTQVQAHRRFLDLLLTVSGVYELENELNERLASVEHLIDWFDAERRNRSEVIRNIFLLFIGVFGVYTLAHYMTLVNSINPGKNASWWLWPSDSKEVEVLIPNVIAGGIILSFLVWGFVLVWRRTDAPGTIVGFVADMGAWLVRHARVAAKWIRSLWNDIKRIAKATANAAGRLARVLRRRSS